ncbi:t-SNARE [Apodospora peruviana]|uniref:t-SNARE n=1 Tax=Apodospora peruviana TaxID=516989 RepID=A0AAE0MBE6_9PEZI|nr:t-SNARE [Apodospora peruviana]
MSYNNQYQSNPYHQAPSQEAGYGYGQQEQHEMQPYGQPYESYGGQQQQPPQQSSSSPYGAAPEQQQQHHANVLSQGEFLGRVKNIRDEIQALKNSVHQIASAHQRALTSSDGSAQRQLEQLSASTQLQNTSIRDQIKQLKADVERTTDGSFGLKKRQFESLNKDYKAEIQNFMQEEQQYKERYREQIARQYRIVNPEATEDEVRQAADADWGNEGIFQTALRSNRSGQASAVLGNVRARHNELQKIEQSIIELAGLFQDLESLIIQQGAVIERAEEQTEQTNVNLDKGNEEVSKGIEHARRRRRLKWWCALVVFLIILAIALGVGLGIYFTNQGKNKTTA